MIACIVTRQNVRRHLIVVLAGVLLLALAGPATAGGAVGAHGGPIQTTVWSVGPQAVGEEKTCSDRMKGDFLVEQRVKPVMDAMIPVWHDGLIALLIMASDDEAGSVDFFVDFDLVVKGVFVKAGGNSHFYDFREHGGVMFETGLRGPVDPAGGKADKSKPGKGLLDEVVFCLGKERDPEKHLDGAPTKVHGVKPDGKHWWSPTCKDLFGDGYLFQVRGDDNMFQFKRGEHADATMLLEHGGRQGILSVEFLGNHAFQFEVSGDFAVAGVFVGGEFAKGPGGNFYRYGSPGATSDAGLHAQPPRPHELGDYKGLDHIVFCFIERPDEDGEGAGQEG